VSQHKDAEYYVTAKGEHVMSHRIFAAMSIHRVLSTLTHMGLRPTKREKK
jgi:hypothetical protein